MDRAVYVTLKQHYQKQLQEDKRWAVAQVPMLAVLSQVSLPYAITAFSVRLCHCVSTCLATEVSCFCWLWLQHYKVCALLLRYCWPLLTETPAARCWSASLIYVCSSHAHTMQPWLHVGFGFSNPGFACPCPAEFCRYRQPATQLHGFHLVFSFMCRTCRKALRGLQMFKTTCMAVWLLTANLIHVNKSRIPCRNTRNK